MGKSKERVLYSEECPNRVMDKTCLKKKSALLGEGMVPQRPLGGSDIWIRF